MRIRGLVLVLSLAGLLAGCGMIGRMLTPVADPAPLTGWSALSDVPDPVGVATVERA